MPNVKEKILIIAGEASGDLHAGALMLKMNELSPNFEFVGIGGDKMISAGLEALYHVRDMAFLGFAEVVKHLPFILKVKKNIINKVISENIKTVILVDYPGFNLNIAKKLKKLGLKIIYFISPQVWAWGKRRIKKMRMLIDKLLVIFPFEEEFFVRAGINVEYVGHPLVERIAQYEFIDKSSFYKKHDLIENKEILLLLPGSRKHEISKIFPSIVHSAEELATKFDLQICIACAENIESSIYDKYLTENSSFKIIKGETYELLKYSKFGIIKSGTSTIEAAYFKLPFIVVYSTSPITYFIGKNLVKLKNIAMANIIAGKTVVPELIQNNITKENIINTVSHYLTNEDIYQKFKEDLDKIKNLLGEKKADESAAKIIYDLVYETKIS